MPYKNQQTKADLVAMSHVCFLLEAFQYQGKLLKAYPLIHASDIPLDNLALFYIQWIF